MFSFNNTMSENLISFDECSAIIQQLDEGKSCKVIDYAVTNYSDGYPGFLGDYFSLKIKFRDRDDTAREERFFMKSLPVSNPEKRKLLEDCGIFKKETGVFMRLIPKMLAYSGLTKWCPVCYLAREDLLVLEDLKVSAYQTLPKLIDPNINHIKMALRSLAAFHAASLVYERFELRPNGGKGIGDLHGDVLFETTYGWENPWCMTGIRALKAVALRKTKYGVGSSYEQVIEDKFMDKVCEMFDFLESSNSSIPKVCCHRDLWKNNLMFRFENGDFSKPLHCLLIDYQICRYLPLSLDVIICILLPSRDHSNTDECLKFYYEQLTNELQQHDVNIETVVSWMDFEESCKRFMLFPLVQQGIFWTLANLPESFLANLLANDEQKYMKMCNEHRDAVVLDFMEKDDFYCETMIETTERLIEYLFVTAPN